MADFNEEDHPRDGGKFTAKGGGPHVAGAEKAHAATAKAGQHKEAAAKARGAAKARRDAASKAKDPAERSEHLARANHHDEHAAHHEEAAQRAQHGKPDPSESPSPSKHDLHDEHVGHGGHEGGHGAEHGEKGGLAKWAAEKLESAKEHVERTGEKLTAIEGTALQKGGLGKAAIEAGTTVASGAEGALKGALTPKHHHHGGHE